MYHNDYMEWYHDDMLTNDMIEMNIEWNENDSIPVIVISDKLKDTMIEDRMDCICKSNVILWMIERLYWNEVLSVWWIW